MKNIIPAFFAVDDGYVPMLHVVLTGLVKNASADNQYNIHILNEGFTKEHEKSLRDFERENIKIFIENITGVTDARAKTLEANYYGRATFYRAFIPNLFPQYDKVLYIDSDLVINADIAELYAFDIGDNFLGACVEHIVAAVPEFTQYSTRFVGIHKDKYFNAGVIIMNTKKLRKIDFEDKFFDMFKKMKDKLQVDPDQCALNFICRGKIKYLPNLWNKSPLAEPFEDASECKIIHYIFATKPWMSLKDSEGVYDQVFWEHAKGTKYENKLIALKNAVTPEHIAKGQQRLGEMMKLASDLSKGKSISQTLKKNASRTEIAERIKEYEAKGLFDLDVENDPVTKPLNPNKIDYHRKKWMNKVKTKLAYKIGLAWFNGQIKKGAWSVTKPVGLENLKDFDSGAIVTCNHINPVDNYLVKIALREHFPDMKKYRLYKVVREGNYSQPGMLGFLMRHGDTLPVNERENQNIRLTAKTMGAIREILAKGKRVLIYPEQAMWWNYRKPRPLKNGAFMIAAKNNVPVIPCFVTMKDTDKFDGEGFAVQEYTLNILPMIYPNAEKSIKENIEIMREKNFALWKELYEKTYGKKLEY